MRALVRWTRFRISSEIIRRDIEKKLSNPDGRKELIYPKTFQQKIVLLNDPRTIQKLQIIEFGVKYKPGKKYLAFLLALSALFFYYNEQRLPEKVVDRYFAISNSSNSQYFTGFTLAGFMFQQPFYYYLPLLAVIHQLSKFVSNRWILGLLITNAITNGITGKYLVDQRVKKYQVWDQERICYGEGTLLSLANMLWGALGFSGGFTALKSRILLKSVPGLGITRAGLPLGYICLFYIILEGYLHFKGKKNSELVGLCAISGFMSGLLIRRFAPLK